MTEPEPKRHIKTETQRKEEGDSQTERGKREMERRQWDRDKERQA